MIPKRPLIITPPKRKKSGMKKGLFPLNLILKGNTPGGLPQFHPSGSFGKMKNGEFSRKGGCHRVRFQNQPRSLCEKPTILPGTKIILPSEWIVTAKTGTLNY